jgi:tRNA A37 threonylcarbamoyladenosine biosynthesis protein TsaE
LDDLGLTDLQEAGGVMLVEWGDVVGDALGTGLVVKLAAAENADIESSVTVRHIDIDWRGMQWETRWNKLRSSLDTWVTS